MLDDGTKSIEDLLVESEQLLYKARDSCREASANLELVGNRDEIDDVDVKMLQVQKERIDRFVNSIEEYVDDVLSKHIVHILNKLEGHVNK